MIRFLLFLEMIPDWMIRNEIRKRLRMKLKKEYSFPPEERQKHLLSWIERMKQGPIALNVCEVSEPPVTFFQYVLGKSLKYSAGFWPYEHTTLDESEEAMLALTVEHANIQDGQKILELGCGWGPLTLYIAKKFPNSQITAVSNSTAQRYHIDFQTQKLGYGNVKVVISDMNDLQLEEKFDRVVSVEMFEHMRNYQALLAKIASFLNPSGKVFIHSAAHKELSYPHEVKNSGDWIEKYFFAGALMPCAGIFDYFQEDFRVAERWQIPGTHYQRTCRTWFELMDMGRMNIKVIFSETYGYKQVRKWWVYWRVFFMFCEELFAFNGGKEWLISHTLLEKK